MMIGVIIACKLLFNVGGKIMEKQTRIFKGADLATLEVGKRARLQLTNGDWVETSPIVSLTKHYIVETNNTIYVLKQ